MEDMIKALLDVVRAQHTATEGTDEAPFDMDDIVDMALNIMGRPDEPAEEASMVESIQEMVETLAPDIFPPKTFEQLSDDERAVSAANMIQENLFGGAQRQQAGAQASEPVREQAAYIPDYEEEEETPDPARLNDIIYQNLMGMMGLQNPQVEYPFDRSRIQYGKEKTFTEQLEEERQGRSQTEERPERRLSAWELAQHTIDQDEEAHQKEPYVPQVMEEPKTKSASQLAAEAIARSQEENKLQMEVEKRAQAMMEEAKKRGQDPMQFALHQQEILRYMEKNSDELVSFEDYEDLSPEEKMEIERRMLQEKGQESGETSQEAGKEIQEEAGVKTREDAGDQAGEAPVSGEEAPTGRPEETSGEDTAQPAAASPEFSEEMLRRLSQEVIRENSEMILEQNSEEDMEDLNRTIMENIRKMMAGSGVPVPQDNVEDLLKEASHNAADGGGEAGEPLSAVELAMDAQKAAASVREEKQQGMTAAQLAREAQERALSQKKEEPEEEDPDLSGLAETLFDELDELDEEQSDTETLTEEAADIPEEASQETEISEQAPEEETETPAEAARDEEEAADYDYADPDEPVLGEHTQAEVDEALENLQSLGLEGSVYERARRMLLLELAGSEAELDAWLKEQESGREKKAAAHSLEEEDDLEDLDEAELAEELEQALSEEILSEEIQEEEAAPEGSAEEEIEEEETEEEFEEEIIEEETEEAGEERRSEPAEVSSPESSENSQDTVSSSEERTPRADAGRDTQARSRGRARKNVVHKKEKTAAKRDFSDTPDREAESKAYQVSVRNPFFLKNSASYMDKFEEYIAKTRENRKLTTGFKRLDSLLRYGLHKGSYFIDAKPQYLKNSFMQQIADRAAESGVDVLYISTELSRYELMTDTISRLSFEMNGKNSEKAVSVMSIMTGEEGADLASLHDEMNWYRGRISEHLFILDQEAVEEVIDSMEEEVSAGELLTEIIRSIVRDGAHKPVVFIDNLENILSARDSADMAPLMEGIRALAGELGIPIVMSWGYAQAESQEERSYEEDDFNASLGNMCDVYLELQYAPMVTEEGAELTGEDIQDMIEEGDTLPVDVQLRRNRRSMKAGCQIMVTPKFNFFEE